MGKGWTEACDCSEQLPIIKLSLVAAYLWFSLTAPSQQGVRPKYLPLPISIDMALLVFPLL